MRCYLKWERLVINGIIMDYYINPMGEIKNLKGRYIKQRTNNRGYYIIDLYYKHKKITYLTHRLIAMMFIPNPENLPTVNHKDGIKSHNYYHNLEWVSYSDNNKHAYDNGLKISLKGIDSPFAKCPEEMIRIICEKLEIDKSPKRISEELGVPKSLVRSIKSGESWTCISKDYKIIKCRKYKRQM